MVKAPSAHNLVRDHYFLKILDSMSSIGSFFPFSLRFSLQLAHDDFANSQASTTPCKSFLIHYLVERRACGRRILLSSFCFDAYRRAKVFAVCFAKSGTSG